jgi:dTDP-4-amino-4,6-dideoxygalactose transaminase
MALFHYIPLHSAPAGRKYGRASPESLPITDSVSARLLRLPIYSSLTDDEVGSVIAGVRSFYEAQDRA